ncbi:hypothetical protein R1flu_028403 [Riccia fluitans]|uniref:Poly [ADP-ribose] polymerase n=1 Tax=Riccia fluitans TaxID=41844 RepID=A0ABD1XLK7_9MARC
MAAAPPPKGWKVEYAKSGRASCKICQNAIAKDSLRIAKYVQSYQFDGYMTAWHHMKCILSKPGRLKSLDDIEGVDDIRWEDSQKLKKYVEGGGGKGSVVKEEDEDADGSEDPGSGEYACENAKSGRATCKSCNEKISKGEVRMSTLVDSGRYGKVPAWRHAKCFVKLGWWNEPIEDMPGFDSLTDDDQKSLKDLWKSAGKDYKLAVAAGKGSKRKVDALEDEKKPSASASKAGDGMKGRAGKEPAKRPKTEEGQEPSPKVQKGRKKGNEGARASAAEKKGNKNSSEKEAKGSSDHNSSELDKNLEIQAKAIWSLKDDLKKNVLPSEMRSMLSANDMDVSGTELELRDRCVDAMLFGATGKCPMCSSPIEYRDGQYKCRGFLTAWSKCTFTTREPERKSGRWKIPKDVLEENEFLKQWSEKDRKQTKKNPRILVVHEPVKVEEQKEVKPAKAAKEGPLGGLSVAIAGRLESTQTALRKIIDEAGGIYHSSIIAGTDCVLTREKEVERQQEKLELAQNLNIPVVTEKYLHECIEKGKRLPVDDYLVPVGSKQPSITKVKVKGRSAVHEDSDLQDTSHILEVGNVIYNVTLNMSDLSTGINSYYILQIIEHDQKAVHHLFRKWGRVGSSKIGGQKLEKMGKKHAIDEFRRLFTEKTGNHWQYWENKQDLEKQPGKFYLVDIDYGVDEQAPAQGLVPAGSKSNLDPRVISLLKMIFDVETFRAAMMEFEINLSEMPLGKLSKRHIERGFQVLTEIQDLMNMSNDHPQKEGLMVDASNRFFTLIPSVQPNVIKDERTLKTKIDMLETLRDIEIASELIGSVGDSDEDPIDIHYKKLRCGIDPIPHDSDDFKLVKRYLERTHAPTHKDWQLELEDVFAVDREGEFEKYEPYKKKLENRMLLWHGSRTTNYVGILSQGLRIAPPEAPVTGYMFGKGLYFADLVSKSAQYCFTTKSSPIGLMLLCEVALGKVKEFKGAQYMEKPMNGSNSTKGVGKTAPLQSEFQKWDNDVTVPCGKPVPSGATDTSLLYNEYIVYDTAQVQLRFLLKVKFKHKR